MRPSVFFLEKVKQTEAKKRFPSKFIDSITMIELKKLDPKQTVEMFTEKVKLSFVRAPADKQEFNEAFIKFIVSDYEFQNEGLEV